MRKLDRSRLSQPALVGRGHLGHACFEPDVTRLEADAQPLPASSRSRRTPWTTAERKPYARPSAILAIAAALAFGLSVPAGAQAVEFQVDRTDDLNFVFPGATGCVASTPNDCTLRGALDRSDRASGVDLVSIPAGTYVRDPTLPTLEILNSVTIAGAGARSTIIEGADTPSEGPALNFTVQAGQVSANTSAIRDVTITKGTNLSGGGVASSGAGIKSTGTNLFLDRVTVSGNVATGAMNPGTGAGIAFDTAGRTLTIDSSTIAGNRAVSGGVGARGAGIEVSGGSASIRSSTIAGNVADGNGTVAQGGGLAAVDGAGVTLDRVTVAGNVAEDVGATQAVANANLLREGTATISATRSIVADGIAPPGSNSQNCVTPITSQGMNVEDRGQCGFNPPADRLGVPVGLGTLADNGGPTNTRAITQSSPAFDFAGDCVVGDQRGFGIGFADCDSGAFELQPGAAGGPGAPGGLGGGAGAPAGAGPVASGTPADISPASVTDYGLSQTRFAAAGNGASVKAAAQKKPKVGTTVRYTLSEAATLRFTVERIKGGRKVAGKCRKPTTRTKAKPKCDLPLKGSFTHKGATGKNSFKFTGRLNRKPLPPGNYQLVASARDSAGNPSAPQRTRFKIVKR
jgi:hypothetical protein